MIHVLLDTTAYRADPRREKAAFRVLTQLATTRHLKIHVPAFVEMEFTSQEVAYLDSAFGDADKALAALRKRTPSESRDQLADAEKQLEAIKFRTYEEVRSALKGWAKACEAELHEVQPHHGALVVEAYFAGTAPFTKSKGRDDFPDAFIYQSVLDLAARYSPLLVVAEDVRFRQACAKVAGVEVFQSLNEFVEHSAIRKALGTLEHQARLEELKGNFPFYTRETEHILNQLFLNNLKYRTISDPHFRSDSQSAELEDVDEVDEVEIDPDEIEIVGTDTLMVPFRCRVGALALYSMDMTEYDSLDEYEADGITIREDENTARGVLEASEHILLSVQGKFSVSPSFESGPEIRDPEEDYGVYLERASYSLEELTSLEIREELK